MRTSTTIQSRGEVPPLTTPVKVLLVCGILSSLLYVGTDILAAMLYPGYSYTSQMISELGAIGAPTRSLWMAMSMVYNPLVIAFGIGVWRVAGHKRSLRIAAILLMAYGVVSGLGPFVPMHVRGAGSLATDAMHILCTIGMVVLILLFIGFGSGASGKGFRFYSIGTILTIVLFGGLAGAVAGQMAAGAATPGFGILERVNIYGEMLWALMLAVTLLRGRIGEAAARSARTPAHALPATPLTARGSAR